MRTSKEKDELAAYKRHCKDKHPNLPEPNCVVFSNQDLTKTEKEALSYMNNALRDIKEIVQKDPDLQEMIKKGKKT